MTPSVSMKRTLLCAGSACAGREIRHMDLRPEPARTGRTLTDPLGHQDGSQHGFCELVLSLITGRSTPAKQGAQPAIIRLFMISG